MVAIISAMLFANLVNVKDEYLLKGFYIYNSLLAGMGIGYLFTPTPLSLLFVAILSVFTFLLSFMLNRIMGAYGIPILSLPFSIVTIFSYLASLKYTTLLSSLVNKSAIFDISLPLIFSSLFKSFGTIFFLPNNIAGIAIMLILLVHSRIMFIVAISGFYFGVLVHSLFLGSFVQALSDVYAFNYIITAVALCGVFLLPTLRNFVVAMIAVIVTVILADAMSIFFNYYAITVFTIPFNLTVTAFIFMLYLIGYKEFNYYPLGIPEKSMSNYLSNISRFASNKIKIALPFSGTWNVYQGFDGAWTHKGAWRYAYDFVIKKDDKSFANSGHYLEDYYCFGESVLSPVAGTIIACRHDLMDNQIGSVDKVLNWGNYVIIRTDAGLFIEISHLMQYSLLVNTGDYIKVNSIIAKCGNSGYSPQPHIHIQVQKFGILGSETIPFCFGEYLKDDKVIFNSLPLLDEDVKSVLVNPYFVEKLSFFLDEVYIYDVYKDEKIISQYKIKVKMNDFGEFYFEDEDENKLYFYTYLSQFYFYKYLGESSYLQDIFKLIPKIPMVTAKVKYDDYLPADLIYNNYKKIVAQLLSSINQDYYMKRYEYSLDKDVLSSKFGTIRFDTHKKGFKEMKFKNLVLRIQNNEKN
jgi:urea transporter/murein DD-endopeptidase MepM/ murein hydrolase activator NlpD